MSSIFFKTNFLSLCKQPTRRTFILQHATHVSFNFSLTGCRRKDNLKKNKKISFLNSYLLYFPIHVLPKNDNRGLIHHSYTMTSKIRKYVDDFIYFFIDQTPAKNIPYNTKFIYCGEAASTRNIQPKNIHKRSVFR